MSKGNRDNYIKIGEMQLNTRKMDILLSILGLVLGAGMMAIVIVGKKINIMELSKDLSQSLTMGAIMFGGILMFPMLRALLNGLFYKLFTLQKLAFKWDLVNPYYGVPEAALDRTRMTIILVTPFFVYLAIYLPVILLVEDPYLSIGLTLPFAFCFLGCIFDWIVVWDMFVHLPGDIKVQKGFGVYHVYRPRLAVEAEKKEENKKENKK